MEKADEILMLLKQGDERGLKMLFQYFYKPLVMYALKFLPQLEEAEDVVQVIFIKFWEQEQYKKVDNYLRSYLYHAVKNRCLTLNESREGIVMEPVESLLEFSEEESPDEEEWAERIQQVRDEVALLSERSRQVLLAIVVERKRYKEVADALNVSVNTVKTTLQRALSTLRERLDKKTFAQLCVLIMPRILAAGLPSEEAAVLDSAM